MPKTVLTRRRSMVARLTVVAMIASLMALGAAPASAATIDTSASCPSSTPVAGFTDITTLDAGTQLAINCIASYGITSGTSATTFSPLGDVPRWQMALFLTRQATAHGLTLPDGSPQGFTDIGTYDAATQTAINQIKQLNITKGTSATTFDPDGLVSREQMALFLARLAGVAGIALSASPADAFTDDNALSAESQLAINQLAAAGVAAGTSATTFSPAANNLRWHMALFLSRVLAAGGITPPPPAGSLSGTVVAIDKGTDLISVEKSDGTVTAGVDYSDGDTTDTYSVDGTAATLAAFEAALTLGDTIVLTKTDTDANWDGFALKNVTISGGLVGAVDIGTGVFSIVTAGNNIIKTYGTGQGAGLTYTSANTTFTVGGASVTFAQFNAALSHGDTVVVTPDSTGASGDADTDVDAIALTNGSATGIAADVAKAANVTAGATAADTADDAVFKLGKLGDVYDNSLLLAGGDTDFVATGDPDFTQVYTVDGASVLFAAFSTALTNGDEVTYSRAAGTETFALVNKTVDTSFSGNTVTNDPIDVPNTEITYWNGTAVKTFDWSTVTGLKILVDGVLVAEGDLEGLTEGKGLPIWDAVSYTMSTKTLSFTNATSTPTVDIADVQADNNGVLDAADRMDLLIAGTTTVIYDNLPATFGTPNVRYFVNATQVTQAVYEDYMREIFLHTGNTTGDAFQATLDGSFVEHRLTTTEVLP